MFNWKLSDIIVEKSYSEHWHPCTHHLDSIINILITCFTYLHVYVFFYPLYLTFNVLHILKHEHFRMHTTNQSLIFV